MQFSFEKVNIGSLWTILVACVMGVVFMFTEFARSDDLDKLDKEVHQDITSINVDLWYGQYYARLDDYEESTAEGNVKLADEHARQMERLKGKICKHDPDWERCDG